MISQAIKPSDLIKELNFKQSKIIVNGKFKKLVKGGINNDNEQVIIKCLKLPLY
jgi:hypothetical protein